MMKQREGLTFHIKSELKKTWSWTTVGPATAKHQAPTNRLKLYVRAIIESEAWPNIVQLKIYNFKKKPPCELNNYVF